MTTTEGEDIGDSQHLRQRIAAALRTNLSRSDTVHLKEHEALWAADAVLDAGGLRSLGYLAVQLQALHECPWCEVDLPDDCAVLLHEDDCALGTIVDTLVPLYVPQCSHPRFFVPEDGIRRCAFCHVEVPPKAAEFGSSRHPLDGPTGPV